MPARAQPVAAPALLVLLALTAGGCSRSEDRRPAPGGGGAARAAKDAAAVTPLGEEDVRNAIAVRRGIGAEAEERSRARLALADALAANQPLTAELALPTKPRSETEVARALGIDTVRYAWVRARIGELAVAAQRLDEVEAAERFRKAHRASLARARTAVHDTAETSSLDAIEQEIAQGSKREAESVAVYRTEQAAREMALVEANREALGLKPRTSLLPAEKAEAPAPEPEPAAAEPGAAAEAEAGDPKDADASGETDAAPPPAGGGSAERDAPGIKP